jgi:hypothetical protein
LSDGREGGEGAEPQAVAPPELPGGFSRRALTWGIGIAAASFTLAVLWSAFGDRWLAPRTAAPSTFSVSAIGHAAAARFLRDAGLGVSTRQSRAGAGMDKDHPLVLAEPASLERGTPEGGRFVAAWEEAGRLGAPRLVVLPKWRGVAQDKDPRWLGRVALLPPSAAHAALAALLPGTAPTLVARRTVTADCQSGWTGAGTFAVDLRHAQLLAPAAGLEPEVSCPGGLLVARLPARTAAEPASFVLADPDVLNNQGLGRADHAALLYALFATRMAAHGVVFDETLHGYYHEPGLLAEALRFPLVLALTASLVLAGLAIWAGSGRLGKAVPPPPAVAAGKGVLIDTTAALLSTGGHSGESLARYARETLRDVAAASFLPPDLTDRERVDRLARLAATRGVALDLPALLARIAAVAASRGSDANVLTLARHLHRFRVEMTHVARKSR